MFIHSRLHSSVAFTFGVLGAMGGAVCAHAQVLSPIELVGEIRTIHQDNIFREEQDTSADVIQTSTLGGRFIANVGRQKIRSQGFFSHNRYSDHSELNHTSSFIATQIDLQTIDKWSGEVSFNQITRLSDFTATNHIKNMQRNQNGLVRIQLGGDSLLVWDAGLGYRDLDYSQRSFMRSELRAVSGSTSIRYNPSSQSSVGLGLRRTRGKYKTLDQKFYRSDIDLTFAYTPSVATKFSGRISKTNTDGTLTKNDHSATTGALALDWKPTGKLSFNLQALRDTNETVGVRDSTIDTGSSTAGTLLTSYQLSTKYELTDKVKLNLQNRLTKRDLATGFDKTRYDTFSVLYNPGPRWLIEAGVSKQQLKADSDMIDIRSSIPFKSTSIFVGVQLQLD